MFSVPKRKHRLVVAFRSQAATIGFWRENEFGSERAIFRAPGASATLANVTGFLGG